MPSSYHPRSILFVPADDQRKIRNSVTAGADAIALDLEDSVLPEKKQQARELCKTQVLPRDTSTQIMVRINSPRSEWIQDDLAALEEVQPDAILIPKCESVDEVLVVADAVAGWAREKGLRLYPMIESPRGVLKAAEIATASNMIAALAFGAEDFSAAMDIRRTNEEPELIYARSAIITVAKANDLGVVDSPSLLLNDPEQLRREVLRSRSLGFTGKFAIHPGQISPINEIFSPSAEEVTEAHQILEYARKSGQGVFRWNARMIDEAILRQMRRIVDRDEIFTTRKS